MKLFNSFVSIVLFSCISLTATAADAPSSPKSDELALSETEIQALIYEIEQQGPTDPSVISLDDLKSPDDQPAVDAALVLFSDRLKSSIEALSDMKSRVLRYSVIVNQANLTPEKVALITSAASEHIQKAYNLAMTQIADTTGDEQAILKQCISSVCVIQLSEAFEELTQFAKAVNRDLDFSKLEGKSELFWRFKHNVLNRSFAHTFRTMIPNNQDHNAYRTVLAGLFTPVSVAGVTTIDALKAAGSAVFNPRYRKIKLTVDAARISFRSIEKSQEQIFRDNFSETDSGNRKPPVRPVPPPPATTPAPQAPSAGPVASPTPVTPPVDPVVQMVSQLKELASAPLKSDELIKSAEDNRALMTDSQRAALDNEFGSIVQNTCYVDDYSWNNNTLRLNRCKAAVEAKLKFGAHPNNSAISTLLNLLRKDGDCKTYDAPTDFCHTNAMTLSRLFITYGLDPSIAYDKAKSSLLCNMLSENNINDDMAKTLISQVSAPSNLNACGRESDLGSPLIALINKSSATNSTFWAKVLISMQVDLNVRDSTGNTALWYSKDKAELYDILKAAGANF